MYTGMFRKQTLTTPLINILLMLALSFYYSVVYGQQGKTDSLLTLLGTNIHDTVKLRIRSELGEEIPILRITYWDSIRQEGKKWNLEKYVAEGTNNIGVIYDNLGDESKALTFYREGLKMREEIGDKHGIAESLNNIAFLSEKQGDVPQALEYHHKALKIQEEINDEEGISISLNNIATIYEYQDDIPKALEYYRKSLQIGENLNNKEQIATALNNIGTLYHNAAKQNKSMRSEMTDSFLNRSMEYYMKSLKLFRELNDDRLIATLYQNIGTIYYDWKNLPVALDYFRKSLVLSIETKDKRGIANSYYYIGGLYLDKKNYREALNYEQQALSLSKELGIPKDISNIAIRLSEIYQSLNNWNDAFKMQELYYSMKDSITNEVTRKASLRQQFQYEYEKKESLLKAGQEKERAVAEEKNRRQKIIIWSSAGGLIMVLVFAGFILRSLRITRKQKQIIEIKNRETESQKKIIEEKNKDITDSINYAKRIQQAKLPDLKEIYSAFPDSFILFKPKDIVSGDFYFFTKKDDIVFIAAADCTGHGVPGAFVSLIGSEKLEDAVYLSSDTSEILKHLNIGVKNSLHQFGSDESTRDGMDIAICSVYPSSGIVNYSGANRPVWLIRKGKTAIEEIQGTKKAIGGLTEEDQCFETHIFELQSGDTFYIFSNGYADTFNGVGGKKLKTKKFKQILLEIQDKPMPDQGQYLDEFIEKWKAGVEQNDDILIIGVRL
jgi:serine phosphatase RsbU (regulator of sigma subunit)/tetratricopeptide (TPR) repeat protein